MSAPRAACRKLCSLKAGGVMQRLGSGPTRTFCVDLRLVVSKLQRRHLHATIR